MLRAVIFDMDGVLCATVPYHFLSWKRVVEPYQIHFTPEENEKLLGLTRRRSLEVILGAREFNEEQKQEMLRLKNIYYLQYVSKMKPADLMPGVENLLAELQAAGIRRGVASASRNTAQVLSQLGILEAMDAIVDGNSVQRSKPAPDAFLAAAAALKMRPGECIAIEDSAAGVQAARTAGMCALGVGPRERVGQAYAVLPSLEGVRACDLRALHTRWRAASLNEPEDHPGIHQSC